MTMAMREIISALHPAIRQIAGETTSFADVWERHTTLISYATERLVSDFRLPDLGHSVDRHAELFRLVDRASQISTPRLPASVLLAQQALADAVERATNADPLVQFVRASPAFARALQDVITAQKVRMVQPLTVALGIVADDQTSLWSLTDVFAPQAADSSA